MKILKYKNRKSNNYKKLDHTKDVKVKIIKFTKSKEGGNIKCRILVQESMTCARIQSACAVQF